MSKIVIDAAFVERVEERVGWGHSAWDTISPIEICEAVASELAALLAGDSSCDETCARCGAVLNNLSPGFGILDRKLTCMPCIEATGRQPEAIARSL